MFNATLARLLCFATPLFTLSLLAYPSFADDGMTVQETVSATAMPVVPPESLAATPSEANPPLSEAEPTLPGTATTSLGANVLDVQQPQSTPGMEQVTSVS